jgi:hypothetical protein
LNIDIFFTASMLRPYVNITYDMAQPDADDLLRPFKLTFKNGTHNLVTGAAGYTTRYEEFERWVHEDLWAPPFGDLIKELPNDTASEQNESYIVVVIHATLRLGAQSQGNSQKLPQVQRQFPIGSHVLHRRSVVHPARSLLDLLHFVQEVEVA